MKTFVACVLLLAGLASASWAGGMFLPPANPAGEDGSASWSLGYFFDSMKYSSSSGSIRMERQNVVAQLDFPGLCFTEHGGAFLRAGGAYVGDAKDYNGGLTYTAGLGMRDVWAGWGGTRRSKEWSLGTVLQGNFYGTSEDSKTLSQGGTAKASLEQWDVSLALLLEGRLNQGKTLLYAGPFVQYGSLEVDMSVTGQPASSSGYRTGWSRAFGAAAGARVSITRELSVVPEVQFTGDLSAGVLLQYVPQF